MPLTYSITLGIALGFITFVLIKLLTGRFVEIKPAMWITAELSMVMLFTALSAMWGKLQCSFGFVYITVQNNYFWQLVNRL